MSWEFLRAAPWLDAGRARAWCVILALMTGALAVLWVALSHHGVDPTGKPLGTDFVSFWTASLLALHGRPEAAYQPGPHLAAELAAFPALRSAGGYTAFFYPPPYLLLCLPLSLLPYLASLAAWLAAGLAALLAGLRRILTPGWAVLPMLAFPAVILNAGHGQNAFLSAACFAWCAVLAPVRPGLAGACLGALVFKPHLLLAAPVLLAAARRWRMLAGLAASAAIFTAASLAVFGWPTWRAFLADSALARATLTQGLVDPAKMQSVYAALRVLHCPAGPAYAAQGVATILVLGAVLLAGLRRPGPRAEAVLLAAASVLCTPFLLDYDLAILSVPLAWVTAEAQRSGWRPWEKIVLLGAYVVPLLSRTLAMQAGLPVAPAVLGALLVVVLRRAVQGGRSQVDAPDATDLPAQAERGCVMAPATLRQDALTPPRQQGRCVPEPGPAAPG